MISHKHKCIFVHIPKTAGTSINSFFYPGVVFKTREPDYEKLFGWCPERKLHMQHATAKQLLETGLIKQEHWDEYFKFSFVRNPWDRAYSDYIWLQKFSKINGSFKSFINKEKEFKEVLNDNSNPSFLGDHLWEQSSFFDLEGKYKVDFIGRFENFNEDVTTILNKLSIDEEFKVFENKGKRKSDYSLFYTNSNKKLVESKYKRDIKYFNYHFEDNRKGIHLIKKIM